LFQLTIVAVSNLDNQVAPVFVEWHKEGLKKKSVEGHAFKTKAHQPSSGPGWAGQVVNWNETFAFSTHLDQDVKSRQYEEKLIILRLFQVTTGKNEKLGKAFLDLTKLLHSQEEVQVNFALKSNKVAMLRVRCTCRLGEAAETSSPLSPRTTADYPPLSPRGISLPSPRDRKPFSAALASASSPRSANATRTASDSAVSDPTFSPLTPPSSGENLAQASVSALPPAVPSGDDVAQAPPAASSPASK